jgi:hypothetical protein
MNDQSKKGIQKPYSLFLYGRNCCLGNDDIKADRSIPEYSQSLDCGFLGLMEL